MPKKTQPQELIGAGEAAEMLNMDIRTVHRKIIEGEIPYVTKLPGLRGAYVLDKAAVLRIAERVA